MADTATAAAKPQRRQSSPLKNGYLIAYNFVSAVAWATVLGRTVALFALRGPHFVHLGVGDWTRWTQTMAAMEVLHALLGSFESPIHSLLSVLLPSTPRWQSRGSNEPKGMKANHKFHTGVVRAPVFTTVMQVLSRFVLVWGVVYPFPYLARSPWYSSMLLAWSVTEVIRYSYFALTLSGFQPKFLTWLRYNTFFVLYPIGITSECVLIYYAATPARQFGELVPWVSYAILAVYVPGSYILYTYMMKQRSKVMRNLKAEEAGRSKTQ
ncbi:protein tyrosine phosphatase-like protein [Colletotrichum melonis]|uniref:Very-long-chain (3R)-3-hydroxyacyl-CoA dehydratase n=1 Tax=Colletotrichum melonis TaxID=1209925 RepID=A0AAI9UPB7_9PEZI|nr:protein tyrosine phosphatase-like protein [Colletotrichum melonis]